MKIAVLFNQKIQSGGAFNHLLSIANLLKNNQSTEYEFFFFTTEQSVYEDFNQYGINLHYFKISIIDRFISLLVNNNCTNRILKILNLNPMHKFDKILNNAQIDLVYFTSPSKFALMAEKHNYILTVFDLCHRDYYEFPEIRENGIFEKREYYYRECAPKAFKVLIDSEIGRQNIIRRYCLDDNRVVTFPFQPSISAIISDEEYNKNHINIKNKYNIPGEYIYYPAQFWPHKNHIYIIEGLKVLTEKYNIKINAVFSGSDKGNLKYVLEYAERHGIRKQIFYTGFVKSQEIPYLYKQSIALVMPTYFGPTNIPPLEAFALKVPVLYSDLPGLRDQVNNAGLLLDLSNPESMAIQILRLNNDVDIKNKLIANGYNIFLSLNEKNHWMKLKNIFDAYAVIEKCWKS